MQAADKRGDYEKISFSANCRNNGFSAFRLPFRPDRGGRAETGCLSRWKNLENPVTGFFLLQDFLARKI